MQFVDFMNGGLLDLAWWQIVLATLAFTHLTIAGVTIYLHRSQAHRALDLHPAVAHVFRLWLWLTTGMQTGEWVSIHRKHHAKCETPDDPHSPQTRGLRTVLWQGAELYMAESMNRETLLKYGHGTPRDWIERHLYSRFTWEGCGVMLAVDLMLFGWAGIAVWAVQMMWIPFFAAGVINGIGHFWGYRNFDSADASTNIVPWGILIGGEELHNNHHTYPTSARLSSKWYEFDLGWMYIRILSAVRLAHILRVAPQPRIQAPRPGVDFDTLQAVVTNRYDLLARYARGLRETAGSELGSVAARVRRRWLRALGRGLPADELASLPVPEQRELGELLERNRSLRTLVDMRAELAQLWERSSASREQLVAQLQDWISRAEGSGIAALQSIALRIRSYAPVRA